MSSVDRRSELARTGGRNPFSGPDVSAAGPSPFPPSDCAHEHCITCSDAAPPMRVVDVDTWRGIALCVDARGARSSVEVALVEPVVPGDVLLVHAGTAIAHGAPAEARA